ARGAAPPPAPPRPAHGGGAGHAVRLHGARVGRGPITAAGAGGGTARGVTGSGRGPGLLVQAAVVLVERLRAAPVTGRAVPTRAVARAPPAGTAPAAAPEGAPDEQHDPDDEQREQDQPEREPEPA